MKKTYQSPQLKARKVSISCILAASEIPTGGTTDHFDAKENSIFDRFGTYSEEEE